MKPYQKYITKELDSNDAMLLHRCLKEAQSSPDETKVGAICTYNDFDGMPVACGEGHNRFPKNITPHPHRLEDDVKHQWMIHAEVNAVLAAAKYNIDNIPLTLYCFPLCCCAECAKVIIESGIKRVVCAFPAPTRWLASQELALDLFLEARLDVTLYDPATLLNDGA